MRLIGNKTRLLGEIEAFLARRGVVGGTLLDVFAGTGAVGRHFRSRGFRVHANDLLRASYVRQRTYICAAAVPGFERALASRPVRAFLAGRRAPPADDGPSALLRYLEQGLEPAPGLVARQYAEGGAAGRLYFSAANGARIDAILSWLRRSRREGLLDDAELHWVLCALLEAADRVANISGTYGAFLKKLQASAREPLRLRPPRVDTAAPAGEAHREDGNALVRRLPVDVLYIDPPYNHRQYPKNYHVLEVLAELHEVEDLAAYEEGIYGKTGLLRFEDRLSAYCRRSRRGEASACERAFTDLVVEARAEHIVVSYSEEGILSREAIGRALAAAAGQDRFDFARDFAEIAYRRFRSDRDAEGRRSYRVLAERARDEVREWLFYVRKPAAGPSRRRRAAAAGR